MSANYLAKNPQEIPKLVSFWMAALRNSRWINAVWGKGLERLAVEQKNIPGLVFSTTGKGPDFQIRVGSRLINCDLTTIKALEEHLHRLYYQGDFIIWLHQGPPKGWP
jgi:hypothetical protein